MRTIDDWRTHNDVQQPTLSDKATSQRTLSKLALAAIVLASGWTAWTYMSGGSEDAVASFAERQTLSMESEVHHSAVANAYARLSNALKNQARRSAAAITNEVALFDSRFSLGYPPGTFSVAAVMGKADRAPRLRRRWPIPALRRRPRLRPSRRCANASWRRPHRRPSSSLDPLRFARRRPGERRGRYSGAGAVDLRKAVRQAATGHARLRVTGRRHHRPRSGRQRTLRSLHRRL